MASRRKIMEQHADAAPLESLSSLIRSWRRHWDEVGDIQRSLPRAAKNRLELVSADVEPAMAQTRHLFALEFRLEAVAALCRRLDDALAVVESVSSVGDWKAA